MEINDQHRPGKSSNCAFRNSDRPMLFIILHPKSGVIPIETSDHYLMYTFRNKTGNENKENFFI